MKLRTLACLASASAILAIAACGSDNNAAPTPGPGQDAGFDSNTSSSGTSGTSGADGSSGNDGSSGTIDSGQDAGVDAHEAGYTGPSHFLYAMGQTPDAGATGIMGYTVDPTTGDLAAFDTDAVTPGVQASVPIGVGAGQWVGATTPTGSYLYVANAADDKLYSFGVDTKAGGLTALATTLVGNMPSYALVDSSGKHLYVSQQGGDAIAVYDIAANGAITPSTPAKAATASGPRGLSFSPAGDYLFVANESGQSVSSFKVDATTGALTGRVEAAITSNVGDSNPLGLIVHPTKKILFVLGSNTGGIYSFSYDANGALTQLGGLKPTGVTPAGGAVDLTGKYLYISNAEGSVTGFVLDPSTGDTGAATTLALGAGNTGSRGITLDPLGKYLLVSGAEYIVTVLQIGATGALTVLPNGIKGASGTYSYYDPMVVSH